MKNSLLQVRHKKIKSGAGRGLGCPQQAERAAVGGGAWNGMSERISRSIACLRQRYIIILSLCQGIIAGIFFLLVRKFIPSFFIERLYILQKSGPNTPSQRLIL